MRSERRFSASARELVHRALVGRHDAGTETAARELDRSRQPGRAGAGDKNSILLHAVGIERDENLSGYGMSARGIGFRCGGSWAEA